MTEVLGARLRWESLHLAIAALEATWVSIWIDALAPAGDLPALSLGWLFVYAVVMVTWSRFLLFSERWEERRHLASLVVAIIGMVIVSQLAYAPEVGLISLDELFTVVLGPWHLITGEISALALAGTAMIVLWFRTIHITQEPLTFHFTAYRFRLGVLFVMIGLIMGAALGATLSVWTVFLYFGAGLFAIALARAEQVSATGTMESDLPFTPRWVGTLLGALLVTLLAGWLITSGVSGEAGVWLAHRLSPVLFVFERIIYYLGLAIFYLMLPFLNLFLRLINSAGAGAEDDQLLEFEPPTQENQPGTIVPPSWAENPLLQAVQTGLPYLVVFVVLLLIAWRLQQRQSQHSSSDRATREQVDHDRLGVDVRSLLVRGRGRLGEWLRRLQARGWFGMETVEDLYRNLLLWGARRGTPRAPDETPYEYMQRLDELDTSQRNAVEHLTQAYVNRHYGDETVSPEELSQLQDDWRRLTAGTVDGDRDD